MSLVIIVTEQNVLKYRQHRAPLYEDPLRSIWKSQGRDISPSSHHLRAGGRTLSFFWTTPICSNILNRLLEGIMRARKSIRKDGYHPKLHGMNGRKRNLGTRRRLGLLGSNWSMSRCIKLTDSSKATKTRISTLRCRNYEKGFVKEPKHGTISNEMRKQVLLPISRSWSGKTR